jgi:hypothetical protein
VARISLTNSYQRFKALPRHFPEVARPFSSRNPHRARDKSPTLASLERLSASAAASLDAERRESARNRNTAQTLGRHTRVKL